MHKGNLFILSLVILNIVFSILAGPLNKVFKLSNYTLMFIANLVFLAIPLTVYFIVNRESAKDVLRIKFLGGKDLLFVILISIFIQPLLNFLSGVVALILPNNVSALLSGSGDVSIWIRLFVIAVMPAVLEEFSVRGVVLSNYKHIGLKKSAILTGLLFAILHMSIQMFLYTFVMGILFAYLVHITGSIFSSMLSHFIVNGTQIIMADRAIKKAMEAGQSVSSSADILNGSVAMKIGFVLGLGIVAIISFIIVKILMTKLAESHGMDLKNLDNINETKCCNVEFNNDEFGSAQSIEKIYENNNDGCTEDFYSKQEMSSTKENKEKIMDVPFIITIAIYIIVNSISLYKIFS